MQWTPHAKTLWAIHYAGGDEWVCGHKWGRTTHDPESCFVASLSEQADYIEQDQGLDMGDDPVTRASSAWDHYANTDLPIFTVETHLNPADEGVDERNLPVKCSACGRVLIR